MEILNATNVYLFRFFFVMLGGVGQWPREESLNEASFRKWTIFPAEQSHWVTPADCKSDGMLLTQLHWLRCTQFSRIVYKMKLHWKSNKKLYTASYWTETWGHGDEGRESVLHKGHCLGKYDTVVSCLRQAQDHLQIQLHVFDPVQGLHIRMQTWVVGELGMGIEMVPDMLD